jgi:dTDP-4-dehydrorhamnose 3,5-epimerase
VPYTVTKTAIPEVLILEPKVFGDSRGFFFESFNAQDFAKATGLKVDFVLDNHSRRAKGVLRGLHYQLQQAQGKLVRVVTDYYAPAHERCIAWNDPAIGIPGPRA